MGEWSRGIEDVTSEARGIHGLVRENRLLEARSALPNEQPYSG